MTNATLPEYDSTLFQGAAKYYVRYRTRYPQALFDRIAERFHLDGKGRLLDLGCGAGLVAVPFSDRFAEVIAIDPDPEMLIAARDLVAAREEATDKHITNIQWLEDRAENISEDLGQFNLVTFGRSFHWMERSLVLEKLSPLLTTDGGVVVLSTGDDPWNSSVPWKQAAIGVIKRWLGERRRTGKSGTGTWQPLAIPHEEVLRAAGFSQQENLTITFTKNWTIDTYLGYLYSTAFALPSFFGHDREKFEADLRLTLEEISPSGNLIEELTAGALIATRPN